MTQPVRFTQADVKRAIKGIQAAGLKIACVDVADGKTVIHIGEAANRAPGNEWDEVFDEAPDAP